MKESFIECTLGLIPCSLSDWEDDNCSAYSAYFPQCNLLNSPPHYQLCSQLQHPVLVMMIQESSVSGRIPSQDRSIINILSNIPRIETRSWMWSMLPAAAYLSHFAGVAGRRHDDDSWSGGASCWIHIARACDRRDSPLCHVSRCAVACCTIDGQCPWMGRDAALERLKCSHHIIIILKVFAWLCTCTSRSG